MYYRLSCCTDTGEIRGYQWRELTGPEFIAVATGTRPQGDTEAQMRDSTDWDTAAQNRVMYYGHVWHNGWVTDLTQSEAEAMYPLAAHKRPGA